MWSLWASATFPSVQAELFRFLSGDKKAKKEKKVVPLCSLLSFLGIVALLQSATHESLTLLGYWVAMQKSFVDIVKIYK